MDRTFGIIINNYNYGSYLRDSVESALSQTCPADEVIVVDDGSTDDSLQILESYGDAIEVIRQENFGQRSAYNSGFRASKSELILFLDADDMIDPTLIDRVKNAWTNDSAKLHFQLRLIDSSGQELGGFVPMEALSEGNLQSQLFSCGYYSSPPASGNVYARAALEAVLPMETRSKYGADMHTTYLTPLYGNVIALSEPLGSYRMHGGNRDAAANVSPLSIRTAIDADLERVNLLKVAAANRNKPFNNKCLESELHHLKMRLASLRLDRREHPIKADNPFFLAVQGIMSLSRNKSLPTFRKAMFGVWFGLLAVSPKRGVRYLVEMGCSPGKRHSLITRVLFAKPAKIRI
jgi:glycosyltransferase involved in cell wall biosynthesis